MDQEVIITPIHKSYKHSINRSKLNESSDLKSTIKDINLRESEDYTQMLNLIKRLCPTVYSSSQASKQELENLIIFVDTAFDARNIQPLPGQTDLADFENLEINLSRINQINSLSAILFTEIMRQVAIDSSARGYALSKIWNFSMNCFKSCIHSLHDVLAKLSVLFSKDRAEMDEQFCSEIKSKDDQVDKLTAENIILKKRVEELEEKLSFEQRSCKNYRTKLTRYR